MSGTYNAPLVPLWYPAAVPPHAQRHSTIQSGVINALERAR